MADVVREKSTTKGNLVFEQDKIPNISSVSVANGLSSISFSGEESERLAASLGHAIVGKFSHSIPAAHQIQKALRYINFKCGYTWKYINAKHILIQFEDLADYARLLGGPKGTPVWYIDRHPMRVFKWSPQFDVFCESPIAAIWCNLIALSIHLFDTGALFAIGKLLGTPIQIDQATAMKTRLFFARICVEIDITKAPTEEIVLNLCGTETILHVRWDKIPPYCYECRHVGHLSEACYAHGKRAKPEKRNYNTNLVVHSSRENAPHPHVSSSMNGNAYKGGQEPNRGDTTAQGVSNLQGQGPRKPLQQLVDPPDILGT
ncbi:hypothetical protein AAHA92_28995 [Salvia divinorum]|uniref:DUF4283 domain-containing protein n=1 Tax=Salvia divinorum TaxID=28513 RepID=A0ABD1FWW9_SALDI